MDSLDFPPPSEDGDRIGDRVAILEFELRKARETITALRENLTQQAELDNISTRSDTESSNSQPNATSSHSIHHQEPLKAYEQRAINFLVHEYLLSHGYRLSSITFADENPEQVLLLTHIKAKKIVSFSFIVQDFELWDDVGLNLERPPDLVTLFRHRMRPVVHCTQIAPTEEKGMQTDTSNNDAHSEIRNASPSSRVEHFQDTSGTTMPPQEPDPSLFKPLETETQTNDKFLDDHKADYSIRAESPYENSPSSVEHSNPSVPPSSSTNLQHSARALKEELQHSVEDVRHRLQSFFSKSY